MQSVQTAKTLDIETTVLNNPKLNKNKQLSAGIISSKTNSAVYIETPELINPFGLSTYDGGKGSTEETKSWSIVLKAFGGKGGNQEDIDKFFKFLKDLDEKIIDFGLLHSQTLFKKKYDASQRAIVVDLLYNRGVKSSVGKDGTVYPDQIKLKVMKNDNMMPDVNVFKDSATPLSLSSWEDLQALIPKGTPIKAIIQPRLYIVNGKFGTNFRVIQIKLPNVERVGRPIGYAFSEAPTPDTPSDDVPPPTVEKAPVKVAPEVVADSEEEEEEEEEDGSEVEVEED